MFSGFDEHLDKIGNFILKLAYPHEHNHHRPWALQSHGLVLFIILLIISQAVINISTRSGQVFGFATNISVSEVVNLTNTERASAGLQKIKINSSLNQAAEAKANDMFAKDYWAHFAPDGTSPWYFFGLVGYKYTWAGENLARDFATSGGVVDAWMDSSGHRANILNANFTEIGVAVVNGNLEGEDTTLVVQLFGKPVAVAATPPPTSSGGSSTTAQSAKIEAELNVPKSAVEETAPSESQIGEENVKTGQSTATSEGLPIVSLVKNSTNSQKVTLTLLALIAALFVLDSFIIFRRRHTRAGSHSFAHACIILLLMAATLIYGQGAIL